MKTAKLSLLGKFLVILSVFFGLSCTHEDEISNIVAPQNYSHSARSSGGEDGRPHSDTVRLGAKLPIPYEITVMRRAANELVEKGAMPSSFSMASIQPTHLYIRFTPLDSADMDAMYFHQPDLILFPYPLDYEVLTSGGNFYRAPYLPEGQPDSRYTVVPVGTPLPNIPYTILAQLFMDDDEEERAILETSDMISPLGSSAIISPFDFYLIQQRAYEISGLEFDLPNPRARSNKWRPKGQIMAYDNSLDRNMPVAGVSISIRNGWRFTRVRTNADGSFVSDTEFSGSNASYSIKWEYRNERFDIRSGRIGQAFTGGAQDLKKGNDWKPVYKNCLNAFWATIFRGGWYYLNNNFGFGNRPFDYISVEAYNGNGPKNVWGYYWAGRPHAQNIQIWRYNHDSSRIEDINIFAISVHEFAHAHHHEMQGSAFRKGEIKSRLKESWAVAVEYFLTKLVYGDSDIKRTRDYWLRDYYSKQYNWRNKNWGDDKDFYGNYTPLVIDLIDDYDQDGLIDRVSGFTLRQIADILAKSGTKDFADFNKELKALRNPLARDEDLDILFAEMELGGYVHSAEIRMLEFDERNMWQATGSGYSVTPFRTNTADSYLRFQSTSATNMTAIGNHPIKRVRANGQNWERLGVRIRLSMPENTPWIQGGSIYAGNLQLSVANAKNGPFGWAGQFDINKVGGYVQNGRYHVQYEMILPDWEARMFKQGEPYLRIMFSANARAEFNLYKIEFFDANQEANRVLTLTAQQRSSAIPYSQFIANPTFYNLYANDGAGLIVYQTVNGQRHFYQVGQDVNNKMYLAEMWARNIAYEPGRTGGLWRQCWIYLGRE